MFKRTIKHMITINMYIIMYFLMCTSHNTSTFSPVQIHVFPLSCISRFFPSVQIRSKLFYIHTEQKKDANESCFLSERGHHFAFPFPFPERSMVFLWGVKIYGVSIDPPSYGGGVNLTPLHMGVSI